MPRVGIAKPGMLGRGFGVIATDRDQPDLATRKRELKTIDAGRDSAVERGKGERPDRIAAIRYEQWRRLENIHVECLQLLESVRVQPLHTRRSAESCTAWMV